jgi:uncharacterized protein (TIGR03435 family)
MWALAGVLPLLWAGRSVAPGQEARFEAVSIKANRSGEAQTRYEAPTGRLNAINVPLRFFIRRAFDLPDARIVGGPAWLETDRFDIVATLPPDADGDVMRRMMQTLLTDRFTLTARREVRELPVYSLVRLRQDALGPSLRASASVCDPDVPRMVKGRVECGLFVSQGPASASLRGGATTFVNVARILGEFLERPLIDKTGLTGTYDLELQFTASRGVIPGAGTPGGLAAAASPDEIPSVFTAVQEQLGLRLVPERAAADVLVIEGVSRPAEN